MPQFAVGAVARGLPRRDLRRGERHASGDVRCVVQAQGTGEHRGAAQRDAHQVAAAVARPFEKRDQRPERREVAGAVVGQRARLQLRRSGPAVQPGETGRGLRELLPTRLVAQRPLVPIAIDRCADDARAKTHEVGHAQAQAFHRPAAVALGKDIGSAQQVA